MVKQSNYIAAVDGLRGVSVLAVMLFHMNIGPPGGYLGVDVFFVISGFLITDLIWRSLDDGAFSIWEFWVRRLRRIVPAMIVVLGACLAFGYVIMVPDEYGRLARDCIAQVFFLLNVSLSYSTEYFAVSAESNPLLHLWSLSVEEQFYLLYPILLMVLRRAGERATSGLLLLLAVASFLLSIFDGANNPTRAFYLVTHRAWEFFAGGLLVFLPPPRRSGRWLGELVSVLGAGTLLTSMLLANSEPRRIGMIAVIPVLGTVTLLYCFRHWTTTNIARWMSSGGLVSTGRISYSLYLWHWPVIVFSLVKWGEAGAKQMVAQGCCIFLAAIATFCMIEEPVRRRRMLRGPLAFLVMTAGTILTTVGICFAITTTHGAAFRFPSNLNILREDIEWRGLEYEVDLGAKSLTPDTLPILGMDRSPEIDFVLWGDSHALAIASMVDQVSRECQLSGRAIIHAGTPPLLNAFRTGTGTREEHQSRRKMILEFLHRSRPRCMVLVCRWGLYTSGWTELELSNGHVQSDSILRKVDAASGLAEGDAGNLQLLHEGLVDLQQLCDELRIELWIMKPLPTTGELHVAKQYFLHTIGRGSYPSGTTTRADHERLIGPIDKLFENSLGGNARIIDASDYYFDDSERTINVNGGRAVYRDDDHVTRAGAQLMSELWKKNFQTLSRSGSPALVR